MEKLKNATVVNIDGVFTVNSQKGRREEMKNRQWYGISFCLGGQITYVHNGKKFVSDKNCAVILPMGASYTVLGDKTGLFPLVNFSTIEFLCHTFKIIPIDNVSDFMNDFEKLKNLYLLGSNRAKMMSVLYDIIAKLTSKDEGNKTLIPAIKFIEKNYGNSDITNTLLAEKCSISEVYLRKLFLKNFNMTPKQYIMDIRINKAKQLLSEGSFKINAVSEQCGFANPYHFSRYFKEKTGLTPTEYMKENMIYEI
ncbi:MAG: helix-turn-helix transcriptional regulator [Clostridia bacterium]|nr:helix-turn-helix transcriptional regulator [Clostridia bacterium]